MTTRSTPVVRAVMLAGLVSALAMPAAEARPGGGGSAGSRGGMTSSAPPSTATAPRGAQPMQRTETPNVGAPRPGVAPAAAPSRGFGFGGGLMTGLLGAGLLGMMFGGGFAGGLGSLASMFGLLLQVALIGGLIWLALRFFRQRSSGPALAGAGAPYSRSALGAGPEPVRGGSGGPAQPAMEPVTIGPDDYAAFERSLGEIQLSYGRGDLGALRRLATPEMARYFEEDLAADRGRGIRNEVTEPKLLQGDLAQAWREGSTEYATVAMRFEIVEAYVEIASGRVVSGNRSAPTQATELWTFRRDTRGPWILSAIQQTA